MYRTPSAQPLRFSIEEQARSAAKSYLVLGCVLATVHLGIAGWLVADHLGFLRHFLSSRGTFLRSEVVQTLIAWATLPISLAYLFRVWRRARRGEAPGLFARLARNGDPANVAAEIEREVNAEAEVTHAGSVFVTRSWLVHQHTFGFDARPLSEIVWAHAVTTTYKVNGVSVGRTRGLAIYTRFFFDGLPLDVSGSSGVADVPVSLVRHIEIFRGVLPVRFGADALGGAVNLVPDKQYQPGAYVSYPGPPDAIETPPIDERESPERSKRPRGEPFRGSRRCRRSLSPRDRTRHCRTIC